MSATTARRIITIVFLGALLAAATLLLGTHRGRAILRNPHEEGQVVQTWVAAHPYTAPVAFLAAYIALGVLALPVWWLQILSGYGFGLVMGVFWSQIGSTVSSLGAAGISRYVLGDWFHNRVESHIARLNRLDRKLGHNGLLVVCVVRLLHFIPAGPANLAFGLTRISLIDITLGTLIGGIPTVTTFVTLGVGRHLLSDWRFITGLVALNIFLLGLVALRYLKPGWFQSIGVE